MITELTSLNTRLDTEEPKTTALQTLTATHTTDIATNTTDILTKQATITSATDLTCNTITTSSNNGISNIIGGFELKRFNTNVIQLNSNLDGGSIIAYNQSTGICAYQALSQVDFRISGTTKLNATNNGVKIGNNSSATEALDVAGNILASGSITASGVNINTTLADILSRLELLENS